MPAVPPPVADPAELVRFVGPDTDIIVPGPNGEPTGFVDALEAAAGDLQGVRVHQLDCQKDRRYHTGCYGDRLRHVSYFLSANMRAHYEAGGVDLVPNDFHAIPDLLRRRWRTPLLAVAASPPDRHGYVSLGLAADYAAAVLGEVPVVVEVNPNMPRTNGLHTFHLSDALGWAEVESPLSAPAPPPVTDVDRAIAALVAERIPDGATLQIGIGAVPGLVAGMLGDHRDLGVHTEVLGDEVMGLIESGAVNGRRKARVGGRATTTIVLGSSELYEWADENPSLFMLPVDISNDPRVISQHDDLCSINATMQVDLLGQCASESLGTHYVSSTGGQADFMRGAQLSRGGQSFIVTHSTAVGGTVSRIVPTLTPGAVVSAHKNLVDKVVTEHGIAELTGRTLRERTEALLGIADPAFRDDLERSAKELGYL